MAPSSIAPADAPLVTFLVRRLEDLRPMFEKHVPERMRSQLSGVILMSHSFDAASVRAFASSLPCRCFHVATLGTIGWDASVGVCCEVEQVGRGKEFGGPGPTQGGVAITVIAVRAPWEPGDSCSAGARLALTTGSAPKLADGAVGHVVIISNNSQGAFFEFMASPDHAISAGGRCRNIVELLSGSWEEVDFIVLTAMDAERCSFNVSMAGMLCTEPASAGAGRDMLQSLPEGHRPVFIGHFQCLLRGQNLHTAGNVESKGITGLVGQAVPSFGFVALGEICNGDERNPEGWNTQLPNATKFSAGTTVLCCYAVRDTKQWTPQHKLPDPYKQLEAQLQHDLVQSQSDLALRKKQASKQASSAWWLRCAPRCMMPTPMVEAESITGAEGAEEETMAVTSSKSFIRVVARKEPGPRKEYNTVLRGISKEACGVVGSQSVSFWIPGCLSNSELYQKSFPVDVVDVFISQVIHPPEGSSEEMFAVLKAVDTHVGVMKIALHLGHKVDSAEVQEEMKELTFWVDRACVDQDDDRRKMNIIRNHLEDFLVNARFVLCLFSSHYLTRLWCIFELCCALAFRENLDTIAIGATGLASDLPAARVIAERVVNMSLEDAGCFDPADRHIIEEKVRLHFHSPAHFEQFTKFAVLCLLSRDTIPFLVEYQYKDVWELWCRTAHRCGFLELAAAMQDFDIVKSHAELNEAYPDSGDATQADKRMALCTETYAAEWFETKVEPHIRLARAKVLRTRLAHITP